MKKIVTRLSLFSVKNQNDSETKIRHLPRKVMGKEKIQTLE